MNWKKRIDISKQLLADVRDMLPDNKAGDKEFFDLTIMGIDDYTSSMAFKENDDDEKETDSWNILVNTLQKCNEYVDDINRKLFPQPPTQITRKEASAQLLEEYKKALKSGDESIISMNVNDWVSIKNYEIIDDEESSSEEESSSSVESKAAQSNQ